MEKNTVTRTFSIGAIYSRSGAAQEDGCAARRHSSAGVRALLWATASARSLGGPPGLEWQASWENVCPNVLTPDSIPQFTIPSLSVQSSFRSLDREGQEEVQEEAQEVLGRSDPELDSSSACSSSSSSSLGLCLLPSGRRAERSVSDPYSRRRSLLHREASHPCYSCSYDQDQHCLDPASRAAFSLPHLAKVTTPYGFVTLSQSPHMASEEALLCQAALRRLHKAEEQPGGASRGRGVKAAEGSCAPVAGSAREARAASPPPPPTVNSSRKPKKRFCELIRKHFTSHGMKSQSD